ncbi:TldE protein, part of TldE/TldD proteolytic complex [hydrothermal vent metagenome]|uniref:TldE protein, part of TldE/TldD proteolytic complex n=1 Tax=hydrothermal vent metagenome TaxID=652676 RepID=A0A3B1D4I6_9ZZZZ
MQFQAEQAKKLLDSAKTKGATEGDLLVVEGDSFSTQVRLGEVEKISNARGKSLGLRLFFGKRSAITSTSDFSPASLEQLVSDTCELAQIAEEDPFSGLPEEAKYAQSFPKLDLIDEEIDAISIDEKIEMALRTERAALETDPRLDNSEGADFSHSYNEVLYVTSNGFSGTNQGSGASLSVSPIASEKGQMQRDYWYSSKRKFRQLDSPESVGQKAAKRTLRRLGARKVSTQKAPIIFEPEIAGSLLGHIASALSGYALYKKASFLTDQIGNLITSNLINIVDDPTLAEGFGSRPFDGEGLPSYKKTIVENGVLKSYLLDTYSGKKLGLSSTGNAVRGTGGGPGVGISNLHMLPGTHSQEEIIASVQSGLLVTELIGFGINLITGDYSRGAAGIWIENGELAYPVEELTIAGKLQDMYQNIELLGNDVDLTRSIAAPTLKISEMMIAGN